MPLRMPRCVCMNLECQPWLGMDRACNPKLPGRQFYSIRSHLLQLAQGGVQVPPDQASLPSSPSLFRLQLLLDVHVPPPHLVPLPPDSQSAGGLPGLGLPSLARCEPPPQLPSSSSPGLGRVLHFALHPFSLLLGWHSGLAGESAVLILFDADWMEPFTGNKKRGSVTEVQLIDCTFGSAQR